MADARLTNGAFYAHFESKDGLVTTVVAGQDLDVVEWDRLAVLVDDRDVHLRARDAMAPHRWRLGISGHVRVAPAAQCSEHWKQVSTRLGQVIVAADAVTGPTKGREAASSIEIELGFNATSASPIAMNSANVPIALGASFHVLALIG